MTKVEEFAQIFEMPPAMLPYAHLVASEQEMDMVIGIGDGAMTVDQIAEVMGMPLEETEELVTEAHRRGVIKKGPTRGPYARDDAPEDGPTTYSPAVFYRRISNVARYEAWGDVPAEARDAVIQWELQEFVNIWRPVVEEFRKDPDVYIRIPNRDVLLLEEALEMVDAATDFAVIACDCREITRACGRPVEVCVRLGQGALRTLEHGHGRSVTKEEMKRIVIEADRAGLMHTGRHDWRGRESFGFCNCCACCCYPVRGGLELESEKIYPRSHYVAQHDLSKCIHCGDCTERCYFGAFHRDGSTVEVKGITKRAVVLDPEKCWGCGLCANTCTESAITMIPLPKPERKEAAVA